MDQLPRVDSCFFGLVPLRTGAMIVGFFCLLLQLAGPGTIAVQYASTDLTRNIYYILGILGIIGAILLIYGVYADNKAMINVYLWAWGAIAVFVFIMAILSIMQAARFSDVLNLVLITAIYLCIVGYCLVVVNSYYNSM